MNLIKDHNLIKDKLVLPNLGTEQTGKLFDNVKIGDIVEYRTEFFSKLDNPTGGLPTGNVRGIAFSNDCTKLAVAHFTSPFLTWYSVSGNTLTKLADPDILPPNTLNSVAFSNDGTKLAVGSN